MLEAIGIVILAVFLLATGFAGSPEAAANTIDTLNRRAARRAQKAGEQ